MRTKPSGRRQKAAALPGQPLGCIALPNWSRGLGSSTSVYSASPTEQVDYSTSGDETAARWLGGTFCTVLI
ncbi:MAG: hypothetical protein ACRD3W_32110, partial [Terriglobales bacterium]